MTEKERVEIEGNAPDRAARNFAPTALRTAPSVLLIACGLAILLGCTTEKKQKWLTIFFDGVPTPGQHTNSSTVVYDENGKPLDRVVGIQTNAPVVSKVKFVAHPPYEDKKCNECHESRFSVKLKGTQKQVCFACHEDFLEKAKVKHQPVENGECSSCHDPHGSSNPKMLVQAGQALCLQCHDAFPKTAKSKHQPVENGECASCHNPHSSNFKGLLVKADGKLCFECHDDTQKQLLAGKVKHQPVENGECSSCHKPHQSDVKKLLIKPDGKLCYECHDDLQQNIAKAPFKHAPAGNGECASCHAPHQSVEAKLLVKERGKLCLDCHEEKEVVAVKSHADTKKSCVDCHDPHAGKDKYFLKPQSVASSRQSGGAK